MTVSYSDAARLISGLEEHGADDDRTDEELLRAVSDWLKGLDVRDLHARKLVRDATSLSNLLRTSDDPRTRSRVRAALAYAVVDLPAGRGNSNASRAWLAGFILAEVQGGAGEATSFQMPRLSREEREQIEEMFLDFAQAEPGDDDVLVERTREFCRKTEMLALAGLFARFHRDLEYLCARLSDTQTPDDNRTWARAALRYLVHEDDVIGDRLGVVGYLDDALVARTAVELLGGSATPWPELLDALVTEWPHLTSVVFAEAGLLTKASEFALVNAGLMCPGLRSPEAALHTALVLPEVGPQAVVIGLLSALGRLHVRRAPEAEELQFAPGDLVVVDGSVGAVFDGECEVQGRRYFRLVTHESRGKHGALKVLLAIEQLHRLQRVDSRHTTGDIAPSLAASLAPVGPIERLLHLGSPARLDVASSVLVVGKLARFKELLESVSIMGTELAHALPMGQLHAGGRVESWPTPYGVGRPLLLFCQTPQIAAEAALRDASCFDLIIVDMQGTSTSAHDALGMLTETGVPLLAVVEEKCDPGITQLAECDFSFWEWAPEEIAELLWPAMRPEADEGLLGAYQHRARRRWHAAPTLVRIALPTAELAEDVLAEVSEDVAPDDNETIETIVRVERVLSSMIWRSERLAMQHGETVERLELELTRLREAVARVADDALRDSLVQAVAHLEETLDVLQHRNPREIALKERASSGERPMVVCRGAQVVDHYTALFEESAAIVRAVHRAGPTKQAVVVGWMGAAGMTRILSPPIADRVCLLLYDRERRTFEQWNNARNDWRHRVTGTDGNRVASFDRVPGWQRPLAPRRREVVASSGPGERIMRFRRAGLVRGLPDAGSEPDGCTAFPVWFTDGSYALFTEEHRVAVLSDAGSASPEVLRRAAPALRPGDAVVFLAGSNSDVLREASETHLAGGRRATARSWHAPLRAYADTNGMVMLQRALREAGCTRTEATVRGWLENRDRIGPGDHADLVAIAAVTADPSLRENLDNCREAIREVRAAHLRAGVELARLALGRLLGAAVEDAQLDSELVRRVEVVEVHAVDPEPLTVPRGTTNQRLESSQ